MFIFSVKIKFVYIALILAFISISTVIVIPVVISVNAESDTQKEYIKWVDFNIPYDALNDTMNADIKSYETERRYNWIELLAYLASKYGGNWQKYKKADLTKLTDTLKDKDINELTKDLKNYNYFYDAYSAVLDGFIGEYEIEEQDKNNPDKTAMIKKYGLKAFSPIASGYSFSHYDDFGSSRTYGFRRKHLGHDLMGSVGTPIIAIESGIVECVGWNQYGGWRIGIRSFDSKRYYYYAHLRKDHPYNDIYQGKVVKAGDVIGYLGMTGYSSKENVNNINTPHLHFGIQLIFDERQTENGNEVWIDLYTLTNLLQKNKSKVYKDADNNEYYRKYKFNEPILESFGN